MAEAPATLVTRSLPETSTFPPDSSSLTGFPPKSLLGEVDTKYLCGICKRVLRNPIQSYCGHRFCKLCIEPLLRSEEPTKCPCCVEEKTENEYCILKRTETFPDNATKREFHQLPSRCLNEGCNWTGSFKEYEHHEKKCEFKSMSCVCGESVAASQYKDHLENHCPKRQIRCPHCDATYPFEHHAVHKECCPVTPLTCKLCGRQGILREHMESHCDLVLGDCTAPRVKCPFGCEYVSPDQLSQHLSDNLVHHVTLLHQLINELRPSQHSTNPRHTAHKRAITGNATPGSGATSGTCQQSGDSSDIPDKLGIMEMRVGTFEGIVGVLNNQIEKCVLKLDVSDRQTPDKEQLTQANRRLKDLERQLALKDATIAELDLRVQWLECTSYSGVLIWKITDFAKKRQDARQGRTTSVYSPPFYTSQAGYKLCARIYLNGDGMGKTTHVSLFFVIMRGQFDALLKWPFRQKVTMMMLDQAANDNVVDAFRPDPTSSSFKRPTSEMNIASGCPLFMRQAQLDQTSPSYVKDDIAFIRVVVDCGDLNWP